MSAIDPGPPPHMRVVAQLDLRTYPRVKGATRASLALIGLIGYFFAFAYLPVHPIEDLPDGVAYIGRLITFWPWAAAWFVAGTYSLASAFRHRVNASGSAGVLALLYVWGLAYLATWLLGDSGGHSRTYLLAGVYVCTATLLLLGSYVFSSALNLSRPPATRK